MLRPVIVARNPFTPPPAGVAALLSLALVAAIGAAALSCLRVAL